MKESTRFLEYEVVITMQTATGSQLEELGLAPEEGVEERIVKYSFDPKRVTEYRQSFVRYKEQWVDAVVCTLKPLMHETPLLLTSYEDFKTTLDGYNKESLKAE